MKLNTLMRRRLTRAFALAFVVAVAGAWGVQDMLIRFQTEELLESNRDQLRRALEATSDRRMLDSARRAARMLPSRAKVDTDSLKMLAEKVGADELHLCDTNGVIVKSTAPDFIGYFTGSQRQTRPFCRLLRELKEYTQDFGPITSDAHLYRKYAGVALADGGFVLLGFDEDRYLPIPDLSAGRILPTAMMAAMLLLVFAAVFFIVYRFSRDRVAAPIRRANESLAKIASGRLDERVELGGSDEMDALAEDINATVGRLKQYIDEAEHRADAEMAMAKSIQANVLPSQFPPYPNLVDRIDIFARMITAKEVGGDFYDFYFVGKDRLALVIADVSGKGIPAALFMMRAKATLQGYLKSGLGIVEAVEKTNHRLATRNDANMFVTAWVGVIDLASGQIEYVNAGHNPPVVSRVNGSYDYLRSKHGPPLAAVDDIPYKKGIIDLAPGDGIFLYTDGVTEAANPAEELYGEDRLISLFRSVTDERSSQRLCEDLLEDVGHFADGAEQADDITMLAFRLNGVQRIFGATREGIQDAQVLLEEFGGNPKAAVILDEIISNIVRCSGAHTFTVKLLRHGNDLTMVFVDGGKAFDPLTEAPLPDVTSGVDEREIGGLGIYMVKKMAKSTSYQRIDNQNVLTVTIAL